MQTKTISLYSYDELSKEAQEKALESWRQGNDYFFLSDTLNERLHELLEENNIKDHNDTSKPGTKPTRVLYSLSYSQGDGACFEGDFTWKKYHVYIRQHGNYVHKRSVSIEVQKIDEPGFHIDELEPENKDVEEFQQLYFKICDELERAGYDFIEYEDSEENFRESCEANGYTFRADGTMENL